MLRIDLFNLFYVLLSYPYPYPYPPIYGDTEMPCWTDTTLDRSHKRLDTLSKAQ